jgi:hypothetical protein
MQMAAGDPQNREENIEVGKKSDSTPGLYFGSRMMTLMKRP